MRHEDSQTELWYEQKARHEAPPRYRSTRSLAIAAPPSPLDGLSFALGLGLGAFLVWMLAAWGLS